MATVSDAPGSRACMVRPLSLPRLSGGDVPFPKNPNNPHVNDIDLNGSIIEALGDVQ